jgi:hypothetical protein
VSGAAAEQAAVRGGGDGSGASGTVEKRERVEDGEERER